MRSFIQIRDAVASDSDVIQLLVKSAQEESTEYRGSPREMECGDSSLVAVVGESVVGVLQFSLRDTAVLITLVHVHTQARDIGIADALMQHALDEFKRLNISWVSAIAQPGDRALKNLFERHGLVAQQIVVGKSLSDPSTEERASQ